MAMRLSTAETIRDGKGWFWPMNSRKAHYYAQDNRTICGRAFVFSLPDNLPGIDTLTGADDCQGCARRVLEAQKALKAAEA